MSKYRIAIAVGLFVLSGLAVLMASGRLPGGKFQFSPVMLLLMTLLAVLAGISLYLWRLSGKRNDELEIANNALTFYLNEERHLRELNGRILEFSKDMLCSVDGEGIFQSVSPASDEILGYNPGELVGTAFWDRVISEDRESIRDAVQNLISGRSRDNFETRCCHGDGRKVYVMWTAEWSSLNQTLFCVGRDVTEVHHAKKRLDETMAELQRSNEELQDFAFVASHDLQEPLRKIQTFSDRLVLKSEHLTDTDRDYIARMQSAARRMQVLIQDLLAYARVSTRGKPFSRCDTNEIIAAVLSDMESTIAAEQASVNVTELPPFQGDARQMRQVFQNLLSNAIKFHQPGQIPSVSVYAAEETDDGWTLCIDDNGIGFDVKYTDKIFLPFQRLNPIQRFSGTGIGLAIAKKIVTRHQAEISAQSTPGKGTSFQIRFPSLSDFRPLL
ncbi:MAG: PAS domain S-box protein [Oleiphilaceae bacterium]|nr:PAS domain S-box protein [Oleiphilaceae bacterium]